MIAIAEPLREYKRQQNVQPVTEERLKGNKAPLVFINVLYLT